MGNAVSSTIQPPTIPIRVNYFKDAYSSVLPQTTEVPRTLTPETRERLKSIGLDVLGTVADAVKARIRPEQVGPIGQPAERPPVVVVGRDEAEQASIIPNKTMTLVLVALGALALISVARA